jgi:hypothetical protein
MQVYREFKDRVMATIRIPRQTSTTFGKDVELMLESKLTFADVAGGVEFGLMAKQRLSQVRKTLFDQLSIVV